MSFVVDISVLGVNIHTCAGINARRYINRLTPTPHSRHGLYNEQKEVARHFSYSPSPTDVPQHASVKNKHN